MKTNEIKIGQVAVTGRVSGLYDKEESKKENKAVYTVKRGTTANGKRYQIFEISVAQKDRDSNEWKNGKGLKVMLWGEVPVENGQEIGILGKLQPDNWTTQDGKEIWGNMLNAFADDIFEPASWNAKPTESKPTESKPEEDSIPDW